jgi:hypothetical protein
MMRTLMYGLSVAAALLTLPSLLRAADQGAADAPRIAGSLTFTCVPDPKSKAAGAKEFEDTLDLGEDRVKSKALAADGFPGTLSIPKVVNGIPTFNIVFKKPGSTATYFIRTKPGGDVTGSFTRVEGGKTLRYTIGGGSKQAGNDGAPAKATASLDPDVLRVNGGYVRLMSVQVAMADAGVSADKAKLAGILKAAGNDQNAMRDELAQGKFDAKQYVSKAEARLNEAQRSVKEFLGAHAAAVEAAQDKPFAASYVYLNQMRGAVAEVGGDAGAKHADQLIFQSLLELTKLARAKDKLTPDAAEKLRERTKADVTKALAEAHRERFEKTLDAMASYKPDATATSGASHTKPAK